jgi:hypothetical protein
LATFLIQPCHLRGAVFAPTKGQDPITVTWDELVERVAPSADRTALLNLRGVQPGSFVGTARSKQDNSSIRNFLLLNPDRSARLDWVLKQDPAFADRLISVYRVDEAQWDATTEEFDTPELHASAQR